MCGRRVHGGYVSEQDCSLSEMRILKYIQTVFVLLNGVQWELHDTKL